MRSGFWRSIGVVALVAGMMGLPMANAAAASPVSSTSTVSVPSRPSVPVGAGVSASAAAGVSPATSAGYNWVDGLINENATFLYGDPISGYLVGYDSAYVGYYAYTDASDIPTGDSPQVGDVYYMHVVLGVIGNPGSGGDMPNIQVQLPDNTALAISASNPTYCYFISDTNVVTTVTCPTPGTGTILPIWLGTVPIASYYMFEEQFPVVTTAPLDGISNPASYLANYNDWAIGEFGSGTDEYDYEPIWVPPVAVNTTITAKPASSTASTSASFSFTSSLGGSTFECRLDFGLLGGLWLAKELLGPDVRLAHFPGGRHRFIRARRSHAGELHLDHHRHRRPGDTSVCLRLSEPNRRGCRPQRDGEGFRRPRQHGHELSRHDPPHEQ